MSQNKTRPTAGDVQSFIDSVADESKRNDSETLIDLMGEITGEPAVMWGPSIVGFGKYHYRYESGREGDMFVTGFSPRKQAMTVYVVDGFEHYPKLMEQLGKHKTGKSCLYIKRLSDVDETTLRELIERSVDHVKKTNNV